MISNEFGSDFHYFEGDDSLKETSSFDDEKNKLVFFR